ncbi:MAG: hypothetical protein P8X65_02215 [Syntrophobacterales bacterium]|jgi:hypothetical protein
MKKTLVFLLVCGLLVWAVPVLAQNTGPIGVADNGGNNQSTDSWAVGVTNPNILGATQGSGDYNANQDAGTAVSVPNANLLGATAQTDSIAVDADAAAQDASTAQDGEANANNTSTAQDGQVNGADMAAVQSQNADAAANDNSNAVDADAAANNNSVAQDAFAATYIPDANLFGADADGDGSKALDSQYGAMDSFNGDGSPYNTGTGTQVLVPDANLFGADADGAGAKAQDSQYAAMDSFNGDGSPYNVGTGTQVTNGDGANNTGSGVQVVVPDANILGADADGDGSVAQWGEVNANGGKAQDAQVAGMDNAAVQSQNAGAGAMGDNAIAQNAQAAGMDNAIVNGSGTQITNPALQDNQTATSLLGDAQAGKDNGQANGNFASQVIGRDGDQANNALGGAQIGDGQQANNNFLSDVDLNGNGGQQANDNFLSDVDQNTISAGDASNNAAFTGLLDTAALGGSTAQGGLLNTNYLNSFNGTGPNNINDDGLQIVNPAVQDNQTQFAGNDANLNKAGDGDGTLQSLNTGGGTQVVVPDATVQALGRNMADDGAAITDSSSNSNALGLFGDAASSTDTGRSIVNDDGAVGMDNAVVNSNDDGFQVINPALQDIQVGLTNAKDDGVAQTGLLNANDSSVAQAGLLNANDSSTAQAGLVNADDTSKAQAGQVNAMDNGVANANNQFVAPAGVGIVASGSSALENRMANNVSTGAAVGMDTAQVVSAPFDSAIAQGNGTAIEDTIGSAFTTGDNAPAFNNFGDAAVVGAGNNATDNDFSAVAQGSVAVNASPGAAVTESGQAASGLLTSAAQNSGDGGQAVNTSGLAQAAVSQNGDALINNSLQGSMANGGDALTVNDQAAIADNGSKVITNPQNVALIDSAQVTGGGQLAVGNLTGNKTSVMVPVTVGVPNAIQTASMTELNQVAAGTYAVESGNLNMAAFEVTTNNSNSTGLNVTSTNMGGIASNVAAQSVVNVSANINQPTP